MKRIHKLLLSTTIPLSVVTLTTACSKTTFTPNFNDFELIINGSSQLDQILNKKETQIKLNGETTIVFNLKEQQYIDKQSLVVKIGDNIIEHNYLIVGRNSIKISFTKVTSKKIEINFNTKDIIKIKSISATCAKTTAKVGDVIYDKDFEVTLHFNDGSSRKAKYKEDYIVNRYTVEIPNFDTNGYTIDESDERNGYVPLVVQYINDNKIYHGVSIKTPLPKAKWLEYYKGLSDKFQNGTEVFDKDEILQSNDDSKTWVNIEDIEYDTKDNVRSCFIKQGDSKILVAGGQLSANNIATTLDLKDEDEYKIYKGYISVYQYDKTNNEKTEICIDNNGYITRTKWSGQQEIKCFNYLINKPHQKYEEPKYDETEKCFNVENITSNKDKYLDFNLKVTKDKIPEIITVYKTDSQFTNSNPDPQAQTIVKDSVSVYINNIQHNDFTLTEGNEAINLGNILHLIKQEGETSIKISFKLDLKEETQGLNASFYVLPYFSTASWNDIIQWTHDLQSGTKTEEEFKTQFGLKNFEDVIGMFRTVNINNVPHLVRVIDVGHDALANSDDVNENKYVFTYELNTILSDSEGKPIKSIYGQDKYDFPNSVLFKNLTGQGSATGKGVWQTPVIDMLPSEIKDNLKEVKKYVATNPTRSSSADAFKLQEYKAKLFPFTVAELGGTEVDKRWHMESEGRVYKFYKDCGSDPKMKKREIRIKTDLDGKVYQYLLSSPHIGNSQTSTKLVWQSGFYGQISNISCTYENQISFCFCL